MPATLPWRALGALAVVGIAALGTPSHAAPIPETAPAIVGVVRDTTGTPLPNARVVIAEINRSTTTGADGTFRVRALRAGTYHLDVTLLGYAPGHAVVTVPEEGPDVQVTILLRPTPLSIEGINVTASPASADPLRITQSTVELSGKALERRVSTSVAQTLASEPGIGVRYAGPAASTPVIRGLSGERVLVLQNGQRTGDLSSTSPDHGLTVDPLAATRVEVVRGPASLLYGNNALGGVVNVISNEIPTSVPGHAEGYISAQGESVNPGGALSGEVAWPLGSWGALLVRGGGRRVDDVRVGGGGALDNTFYNNAYAGVGAGYVGERVRGGASVAGYRFDYGIPAPPDAEEAGVSIDGQRVEGDARFDVVLGESGFTDLRVDGSAQWYRHDEVEPEGEVGTRFHLDTQTAGLTARTFFGPLSGAVGVSALLKQYAPEGEEALTPPADSRNFGVFLYQEVPLWGGDRAPRLQAGARYDVYRIDAEEGGERFGPARSREFNQLSGSVGLSVPLGERLSASVSGARSFRAPTVEELYANGFHPAAGTFDVGNPALRVETNSGVEGVVRAQSERVHAQLSAFYNRIDDFITPLTVKDTTFLEDGEPVTVPLARYVQADAELRGVEGQIEAAVTPRLALGAMGDVVRGDFVGGGPLPFMPAARLGALARWDNGRVSVGVEARHAFEQDRVSENETPTGAYDLVNLNAGYSLIRAGKVHSVTLRVENLLDERYADAASRIKHFAPNPGVNVSLVYRLLF